MTITERRCIVTIHAHPDDESSKGPSTIARYKAEGVRSVLVCCTGGELGDIINPAMDRPEVRENIGAVRREELAQAAAIIGYDDVVMLGYRDSGMPGSEGNDHPESFHRADHDEAVGRLVAVLRRERPQIVITYGDNQEGYPHPDHLKVHEITEPAIERAADPSWYPEAGPPWQVAKMYYTMWSRARVVAMHARFLALGIESPFDEKWLNRPSEDHRITTRISIGDFYEVREKALLSHATQVDPTSKFWFGLPPDEARSAFPYEDYTLARSFVAGLPDETRPPGQRGRDEAGGDDSIFEHDLFAGL